VFRPDGRYVLTGGGDDTIRLWDAQSGELVRQFSGNTDRVTSMAFSPDGRWVLTSGGDGTARLWDAQSGEEVRQFTGQSRIVFSVAFSPNGRYALTGAGDGEVWLWDAQTGAAVRPFVGHTSDVWSVAFSPDSRYALTGSGGPYIYNRDSTARVWDVESGEELRRFSGHINYRAQSYTLSWVLSVAFSPDGRYALSSSRDGTTRLWETDYRDFITYACAHVTHDLEDFTRQWYNLDDTPTCL
jgi:WD40 repeat protein